MIETATFNTCALDDRPIPIEFSRTYQILLREKGEDFAKQFIVPYEVRLKDDP